MERTGTNSRIGRIYKPEKKKPIYLPTSVFMDAKKEHDNKLKYYCDTTRHLVCKPYSIQNLHKMAKELNINRCWFHKTHYDMPKSRVHEITAKCKLVDSRMIVDIIKFDAIPEQHQGGDRGGVNFLLAQKEYSSLWFEENVRK